VSGQLAGGPASIFESQPLGFLAILAILILWISGAFEQAFPRAAPARPPTIRLGAPRLVAMSEGEAAEAAHLLGSSVAELMGTDWENE
jgi:hypothetical protein